MPVRFYFLPIMIFDNKIFSPIKYWCFKLKLRANKNNWLFQVTAFYDEKKYDLKLYRKHLKAKTTVGFLSITVRLPEACLLSVWPKLCVLCSLGSLSPGWRQSAGARTGFHGNLYAGVQRARPVRGAGPCGQHRGSNPVPVTTHQGHLLPTGRSQN